MTIGALRPGTAPDSVLATAQDAADELTTVEASAVDVVAGSARLTVRFTADGADLAGQIGIYVVARTDKAAEVTSWKLTERVKGRWYAVD